MDLKYLNTFRTVVKEGGISDTRITAVCCHHKNKWVSPLMQTFLDLCDPPPAV